MTMNDSPLLVYCTVPDTATANSLAASIIESGAAACVNCIPAVRSVYRWKGEIQSDREELLLIKSTEARYKKLECTIRQNHPYELPEIIAVRITDGLPEYLEWVRQCVNSSF